MSTFNTRLSNTYTKVIVQTIGQGTQKRNYRRPILIHRSTNLVCETATVFLYREFSSRKLNTQLSILSDLTFYFEWCELQLLKNPKWPTPEQRVNNNLIPITQREINDLDRWAALKLSELSLAIQMHQKGIKRIPKGETVSFKTTGRRMRTFQSYFIWLIQDNIQGHFDAEDKQISKAEKYAKLIIHCFSKFVNRPEKKASPPKSLNSSETEKFEELLWSVDYFPDSPIGRRDRLIAQLLYSSGIRVGELLKLKCEHVLVDYEINDTNRISVLIIESITNDPQDERVIEPARKTLPGIVPISNRLANAIIDYIINDRRPALNARTQAKEHPFLFVAMQGKETGNALSQRNINRIFSKYRSIDGLPSNLVPHTLRHTFLNEIATIAMRKGEDPRQVLLDLGRWSPNSSMPQLYTSRSIQEKSHKLIQERDNKLDER